MNRVIQVQNCIRIERDLPLFGIGDPNKYFAPSYCYIISPFDTLYRGQGTPIHPLTRKFYPPLVCMFVTSYCLFLTKPRCSLTSTKLLFPTNVSTIRGRYFQWNLFSENCSSTPFHPKPVSYTRPVVAIAVYSIPNDLEKRKFDGLEPYRSLGNENEQPEANSFARNLACSCSIGDGWCITRSGVDAPPSPPSSSSFPGIDVLPR